MPAHAREALPEGGETHQQATGDAVLTTNQGVRLADDQNSLKSGGRGPTLLEDFVLREKITHFDHERIPERIVHARGSAAHGYFQPYKSMDHVTSAAFLADPKTKTPVFCRFSTVAGGAGSVDLPRDLRGFAVKFWNSREKAESQISSTLRVKEKCGRERQNNGDDFQLAGRMS
jgi:catalase